MHTERSRRRAPARRLGALAALAAALAAGCRTEMYDQPRYEAYEPSASFPDGTSVRPIVADTVARGDYRVVQDELFATGRRDGELVDELPAQVPMDRDTLVRGQQRYLIYCAPCHGPQGDGNGMIVQRGFPKPPPFYGAVGSRPTGGVPTYPDLREAPLGHFYDVITNGHGVMYSYAARIAPEDRWRIAAYLRALQLSQSATADDLKAIPNPNADEQRLLQEAAR
jgi:mono/diheme cytochrome c family protein